MNVVRDALKIRFLGEIAVEHGGRTISLPQSRKTRALLAYLVLSDKPQRRDRLCSLFWDVADDPRGALRWSLSRLRPLVDSPKRQRLVTDRDHVSFDREGVWVDSLAVRKEVDALGSAPSPGDLEAVLGNFRGEFLEGLELPDFDEFQAWCLAEREQHRALRSKVLSKAVSGLGGDPAAALPYARTLVRIDPVNEHAHATLVRLLTELGRTREARRQYESAVRQLRDAGIPADGLPDPSVRREATAQQRPVPSEAAASSPAPDGTPGRREIVGRTRELSILDKMIEDTRRFRRESVVLVGGEAGIGKTRLLAEVLGRAAAGGATVIEGSAFEVEASRPYGPWIDALRKLPPVTVGSTIGSDLAPLVPELSSETLESKTRDRMFGAVVELIAARAHSSGLVVLALDDVQWCDDASAELLHYVVRSNRHRPVLVLLAAREGELPDNTSMTRVLRSLRRECAIEQLSLPHLSPDEALALAMQCDSSLTDIPAALGDASGNPLFVVELVRSGLAHEKAGLPRSLVEMVRDRVERIPQPAPDVLRWGAVFGDTFRIQVVSALSGVGNEALIGALETLERHGLIRVLESGDEDSAAYAFTHNLVRRVVYSTISEPRRRIMHSRAAHLLAQTQDRDESVTPGVVQHAALAGDAALAAKACVAAGKRCLRLFANLQAETFARRGTRFAE